MRSDEIENAERYFPFLRNVNINLVVRNIYLVHENDISHLFLISVLKSLAPTRNFCF